MSYLKINPDLFIGSEELNRFKEFLDDRGFRKLFLQDSLSFGIVNNSKAGNFSNFRVEQGTNAGTIKNADGLAIDKNGNMIIRVATDNIAVPDDNTWYWVKIKHQYSTLELGTVQVDINGNLTGTGTEFLKVLRGQPNNPVRIKLSGTVTNTAEYQVVEVINDTSAILAGDFSAESGLRYIVVGAFTPDAVVPAGSKDIYQYDSCLMTLVQESVLNTPPALLVDEEFVIARIRRNGVVLNIEDKRYAQYKSKSDYELTKIAAATNPLIGVEAIKFDNNLKPRDTNLVYLAWTFRSSNWTIDGSANRLTLISGQGGKFKDTTYFTDGDFDGWRVYAKNSTGQSTWSHYATVKVSSKSGSQINLILDHLDPDLFVDTTQEIIIAPDADSIEIFFTPHPADGSDLTVQRFYAKINEGLAKFPVTVYKSSSCTYNVKYRLNSYGDYRKPVAIPSDPVGYLVESDFDVNGVQTASVRQTYTSHDTNGFITLQLASNAYTNRIGSIETGDLFGVEHLILNNSSPVVDFTVGLKKQYQIVETKAPIDGGQGDPFTLTVDHYINLKKTGITGLKGGNAFIFQFKGDFVLSGFNLRFTQDYINSGNTGTNLYTFTAYDLEQSIADNLLFRCVYDDVDAQWVVYRMIHNQSSIDLSGKADKVTTMTAGDGLSGGGDLSANRSFAVDATVVRSTRAITAGNGLSGGGDLSGDRSFAVNVDDVGIEINTDTLRLKDAGITAAKIADGQVTKSADAIQLLTKVVEIGGWDIDTFFSKLVTHGLPDHTKIRGISVIIQSDVGGIHDFLNASIEGTVDGRKAGLVVGISGTTILLVAVDTTQGGPFDDPGYSSTAINRGWVTFTYTV